MYLSRLFPNIRNAAARRDLTQLYQMHRTIMRSFPEILPEDNGNGRVLFRLDELPGDTPVLLVQSPLLPDWSKLPVGYLDRKPEGKPFTPALAHGQMVAFRLRANPTRKQQTVVPGARYDAVGTNAKKRLGIFRAEEQEDWLRRRLDEGGLRVLRVSLSNVEKTSDNTRIHADNRRHELTFASVRFDGIAVITKPDAVVRTLQYGVGSGKAFGFGMLSLARYPS